MWRVLLDMFSKSHSAVRVAGEMSKPFGIEVGVGHGDPLSTLLFDIYIDDLLETMHNTLPQAGIELSDDITVCATTYADDVSCIAHEPQRLQEVINHVGEWLNKWRMLANVTKSVIMVFHPKEGQAANVPSEQRPYTWTLNGHTLSQVDTYKYLGVWMTENGSWDLHASKALGKGRAALGYWKPLLSCHRLPLQARAMMVQTLIYSSFLYGSEVWAATRANRDSFDVVAKEAIRTVVGLKICETTSASLFADLGLLPPSLLIDAAKQCYLRHLTALDEGRWSKAAMSCNTPGPRACGRPRVGTNWLVEVRNCSERICHDLNVADIAVPMDGQPPARRTSARFRCVVPSFGAEVEVIEVAPVDQQEPLNRKIILDMFWAWNVYRMKAKYASAPVSEAAWFSDCVNPHQRGRASYLSSLPSYKSRAILSARSGKLFSLRARLANGVTAFVPPSDYQCSVCDEHLGDSKRACTHCMVDCPAVWPKLGQFFAAVNAMGGMGATYGAKLESLLGVDLVKAIVNPCKGSLPKELTAKYWAAVADLLLCDASVDTGQEAGQEGRNGQASTGTIPGLADGILVGCENAQAALGGANVHVDAVTV